MFHLTDSKSNITFFREYVMRRSSDVTSENPVVLQTKVYTCRTVKGPRPNDLYRFSGSEKLWASSPLYADPCHSSLEKFWLVAIATSMDVFPSQYFHHFIHPELFRYLLKCTNFINKTIYNNNNNSFMQRNSAYTYTQK